MRKFISSVLVSLGLFALAGFVPKASAYEYPLQSTRTSTNRYFVVGYGFEGNEVVGDCSYRAASGGSGKGGGYAAKVRIHKQTCRWDLYGKLLRVTPGAPALPSPLYIKGSMTVYAVHSIGGFTGADSKIPGRGFVSTPGPHYSWVTRNDITAISRQQSPYSTVISLKSDGDSPLRIAAVDISSAKGRAALETTSCLGQIQPDTGCSITMRYDLTNLSSSSGLAYDTLHVAIKSDAGAAHDFIQNNTINVTKEVDHD